MNTLLPDVINHICDFMREERDYLAFLLVCKHTYATLADRALTYIDALSQYVLTHPNIKWQLNIILQYCHIRVVRRYMPTPYEFKYSDLLNPFQLYANINDKYSEKCWRYISYNVNVVGI
jgi:hypothetical protein